MLISEEFKEKEMIQTATRKFPLHVQVEETWLKFRVVFTDNFDQTHESLWLYKGKWMDKHNRKKLEETIEKAEETLQFNLQQNIRRDLWEAGRERRIEAKIHRLMDRY